MYLNRPKIILISLILILIPAFPILADEIDPGPVIIDEASLDVVPFSDSEDIIEDPIIDDVSDPEPDLDALGDDVIDDFLSDPIVDEFDYQHEYSENPLTVPLLKSILQNIDSDEDEYEESDEYEDPAPDYQLLDTPGESQTIQIPGIPNSSIISSTDNIIAAADHVNILDNINMSDILTWFKDTLLLPAGFILVGILMTLVVVNTLKRLFYYR